MSSWISFPLSDLPIASGRSINPFEFPEEEFELYSVPSHETGHPEITKGGDIGSNKQIVSPGTVLLCKINPRINRTWIVGSAGSRRQIASTEWIAFDSCEEVDQRYLMYFLQQSAIRDYLAANASGVGGSLMRIKPATLKGLTFRMPGIRTQRRIVEKLEELLSDLDAGVAELKAAKRKLAQYRQSLLKAAVEGALTADWRATHGPPQETGAELLQRILSERRARWEQKQLAKFAEQGKAPPKGWQAKFPEPVAPDKGDLPALPEGWVWATVDQLASVGTGVTPLRSKRSYFENGDIPWTTSGALNDEIVASPSEYVTGIAISECRLELYPTGSLLVAMYGEGKTRGKCAELTFPSTINQAIAAIVFEGDALAVKPHVKSFLLDAYEAMRKQASGGVQPNLNLQIIKALPVPFPPLAEQCEIHALLEYQLANYRRLESSIALALAQSTAQRKNLLKAAFAGQLVPQDPNDEPASTLLARIRAAREQAFSARGRRRAGSNPAPATNLPNPGRRGRKTKESA